MSDQPQTVMQASEQATGVVAIIDRQAAEFAKVLPAHIGPEKFARWSLSMIRAASTNPKTADAWTRVQRSELGRLSIIAALMDCASLGLEPGREYHVVPFGEQVTGITDYQGEIRLITNARRCSVIAQLVCKGDDFHMTGANIPPIHDCDDWFDEEARGPVVGGYSFVDYGHGEYSQVTRMSEADFLKHRGKAKTVAVWDEWPQQMRRKTLIHQTRKMVPWSPEYLP